jgi:hypothetical protein
MKKLILTLVVSFAIIAGINAQGRMSMEDRVKMLKHTLALSDSQTVIVDSIFASAGEKMKNIDASGQDRRTAMRQIMEDVYTQVENILSPEQKDKYEKYIAERRSRMQSRPPNNGN